MLLWNVRNFRTYFGLISGITSSYYLQTLQTYYLQIFHQYTCWKTGSSLIRGNWDRFRTIGRPCWLDVVRSHLMGQSGWNSEILYMFFDSIVIFGYLWFFCRCICNSKFNLTILFFSSVSSGTKYNIETLIKLDRWTFCFVILMSSAFAKKYGGYEDKYSLLLCWSIMSISWIWSTWIFKLTYIQFFYEHNVYQSKAQICLSL